MPALSTKAWVYIWITMLASAGLTWSVWISGPQLYGEGQLAAFAALTIAACLAQMFPVKIPKHQAYSATISIIFAAVLLLDYRLLAALIIAAHIPEWLKARYAWHIPLFNISSFVIASLAAKLVFSAAMPSGETLISEAGGVALLLSALTLIVLNHILVAYALLFLRGISITSSGVFALDRVATDLVLVCLGATAAIVWQISPWLLPAALAPLLLVHRALSVPTLQEEVRTEPKTGLYNAKHFREVLSNEIQRCERLGLAASVVMMDLDLLRSVNNTFGHLAGDDVLLAVANILRQCTRNNDTVARFGGDEFVILLPESDTDEGLRVAERIRHSIDRAEIEARNSRFPISVSGSFGVASFPKHGLTSDEVMHEADLAVYWSKVNGRNRSCVASAATRDLEGVRLAEIDLHTLSRQRGAGLEPDVDSRFKDSGAAAGEQAFALGKGMQSRNFEALAKAESAVRKAFSGRFVDSGVPLPLAVFIAMETIAVVLLNLRYWPELFSGRFDLLGVMILAVMGAAAELFAVDIYAHETSVSTSVVASSAAAFLFGPEGAVVVSLVIAATLWIAHRSQFYRFLFNLGNLTISSTVAAMVYGAFGQRVDASSLALALFPAVVAAACMYLLGTWSVSLAVAFSSDQRVAGVWVEKFRWIFPHYLMLGVLGLIVGAAYQSLGISGVLAFVAPPLMMRFALKQYVDKTVGAVTDLKQTNEKLRATQDSLIAALSNLEQSYHCTLEALSAALERHDKETTGHSRRVVAYTEAIARQMSLPEGVLKELQRGALLHDLGKIGVAANILNKVEKLLPEEWAEIRQHPRWGFEIVSEIPFLKSAAPVVLHHHERWDGRGYPDGLAGDAIPLGARIFAVSDALDAMTSGRPYRSGLPLSEALEEVARCSCGQFDPAVVTALMRVPMGELLEISRAKATAADVVDAPPNVLPRRPAVQSAEPAQILVAASSKLTA